MSLVDPDAGPVIAGELLAALAVGQGQHVVHIVLQLTDARAHLTPGIYIPGETNTPLTVLTQ